MIVRLIVGGLLIVLAGCTLIARRDDPGGCEIPGRGRLEFGDPRSDTDLCMICNGLANESAWSPAAEGTPCTGDSTCNAGSEPCTCHRIDGGHAVCVGNEICNGLDDNSNGETDETSPCSLGDTELDCETGCGSEGRGACGPGCVLPVGTACIPIGGDTCNACDDDGDGLTDEDVPCMQGSVGNACTVPDCRTAGTFACSASCEVGECKASSETCNACDDDRDGHTDEEFDCIQGLTVACPLPCGTGTGTCTASCHLPSGSACIGPTDICNGVDDDCDGQTDEDAPSRQCWKGQVATCRAGCSTGIMICGSNCTWQDCSADPDSAEAALLDSAGCSGSCSGWVYHPDYGCWNLSEDHFEDTAEKLRLCAQVGQVVMLATDPCADPGPPSTGVRCCFRGNDASQEFPFTTSFDPDTVHCEPEGTGVPDLFRAVSSIGWGCPFSF